MRFRKTTYKRLYSRQLTYAAGSESIDKSKKSCSYDVVKMT